MISRWVPTDPGKESQRRYLIQQEICGNDLRWQAHCGSACISHTVKTDISPRTYDDKLNWYHGRVCGGTGTWLLKDETVQEMDRRSWRRNEDLMATRDPRSRSVHLARILLLDSNRCSCTGKTFLSGTVVDTTRAVGPTAFAFLSHTFEVHQEQNIAHSACESKYKQFNPASLSPAIQANPSWGIWLPLQCISLSTDMPPFRIPCCQRYVLPFQCQSRE